MKYLLKVTGIITLLSLLIAISYLPTYAQNTAPVPTTFDILSPADGDLPLQINHNYGTGSGQNKRIFYGGDFRNRVGTGAGTNWQKGFAGWIDAGADNALTLRSELKAKGNFPGSRLTLGGTKKKDDFTPSNMIVANLPGSIVNTSGTSFDTDDLGQTPAGATTYFDYTGANGYIAINEEDSLVIRLSGYIDPNNRTVYGVGSANDFNGAGLKSKYFAFDIGHPTNDSANGARYGYIPSTLPDGAAFNGDMFVWVPNFIQGDGAHDNSIHNGIRFVDANVSNGSTTSSSNADTSSSSLIVGRGVGELKDSLYVIYFTATDDGIPPLTGMDSLFIMVNDSIANPPPAFTRRDVVNRSGNVVQYTKSSVQFTTDSLLRYSEGDSIKITFRASDQDSSRGGGDNERLTFFLQDWSSFLHRTYSHVDSLALDTASVLEGGSPRALRVRLRVAYNVSDTSTADTVRLIVGVRDPHPASNTVYDTMLFRIANVNRTPIWDADTSSRPSDSALVYAFEPAVANSDSIDAFSPLAVANGRTDSLYFTQYVYDPDPLIGDSLGPTMSFTQVGAPVIAFLNAGLMVLTLSSQDTVSYPFTITAKDSDPNSPKSAAKSLSLRVAPQPLIAEFYPREGGYPGQDITIFGSGFGLFDINSSTPSKVVFRARTSSGQAQNLQATINSWSRERINLTIPRQVPVSPFISASSRYLADTVEISSAVFATAVRYPYIITAADTNAILDLAVVNLSSSSATIKWRTAFTGTDSVIRANVVDTLDVTTTAGTGASHVLFQESGTSFFWPIFVTRQLAAPYFTLNRAAVTVSHGATSTTDQVHYVTLTNLTPSTTFQFIVGMENKIFFGDSTHNINGPYFPKKIDRSNASNGAISGFRFKTPPEQNVNGETYTISGKVFTNTAAAVNALVTVKIVDFENVADTSMPLTQTVGNDSAWVMNLGDAVTDTSGVGDRIFRHKQGDFLVITITGDKNVGFVQYVATRGSSSPQVVNLDQGGTLLVPSVDYDMRLLVGLNLVGLPVQLFATQPQTAEALLNKIQAGTPSISRFVSASGTQETITKTISAPGSRGFVGPDNFNLALYQGYFVGVDGQEFVTLSGSVFGDTLPPLIFGGPALYWISRPAQVASKFYAWQASTMLANIPNASEIHRFNELLQGYEDAIIDPETGAFVANSNFNIDVSKGYVLRVTAAGQWDINIPTSVLLANVEARFGNITGVTPSLTVNTAEGTTGTVTVSNVRLSDVTSSAAKVSWATNGVSNVQVQYGKAAEGLNKVASLDAGLLEGSMREALLLGLEPETDYVYEITANGITYNNNGLPFAFKTAKIGIGIPYTVFGRLVDEKGAPLAEAVVYVEARRGDKVSSMIADATDKNGYWNVNLANLKLALGGAVYSWNVGDEIRVTAVYGNASTAFRTLVSGESPQNVVRMSDGDVVASRNEVAKVALPKAFALSQNYPNPFNPSTTIAYDIPENRTEGVQVELKVYNIRGQVIRTLVNSLKEPGHYVVQWIGDSENGESVASGVYFYRIKAGDYVSTRKMVLLK